MLNHEESITAWIHRLKQGDEAAAQKLWEAYFLRMVQLARKRLGEAPRATADEEDVALSAFHSFCTRAQQGQFTQLQDRSNLWPLLMVITANKSVDLIRRINRQRRGGAGKPDAGEQRRPSHIDASELSDLISREPDPEFTARMSDELEYQLARLARCGDPDLKRIALMRLEGYSAAEIADVMECSKRSIERKLQVITSSWMWDSNEDSRDS